MYDWSQYIWSQPKNAHLVTVIWSHSRNVLFGHSMFGHRPILSQDKMLYLVTANLVTGVKWHIWSQPIWSQRSNGIFGHSYSDSDELIIKAGVTSVTKSAVTKYTILPL